MEVVGEKEVTSLKAPIMPLHTTVENSPPASVRLVEHVTQYIGRLFEQQASEAPPFQQYMQH